MIDMQDDGSEDSESDYNNYFEAGVCKISIKCCRKNMPLIWEPGRLLPNEKVQLGTELSKIGSRKINNDS